MILVDWGNGSGFPYNQATANTRVVGAEVAVLVSSLNRVLGTTNSQYHLIGHSLGAHIAGYAGSRLPGLGRITGNQYYWILSWDLNYPDELFIIGLRVRKKILRVFTISCYSGLDPAQPNYQNFDDQVRLDQGDAVFVDAIHTDGSDYDTISGLVQNV